MPEKQNSIPSDKIEFSRYKAAESDQRLDLFLAKNHGISRSQAQKIIKNNQVIVNEETVSSPSYRLSAGDSVSVSKVIKEKTLLPQIEVIYEDDNIMVINKPYGVLSHPTEVSNEETVADLVSFKTDDSDRAAIVHRLDRTTTGVMVLAKNSAARQSLLEAFKKRQVQKQYLAVVEGTFKDQEFIIDLPIARHPKKEQIHTVDVSGRPSSTKVKVLASTKFSSLLLLTPRTGRTHQLRVHLSYLNKPIVGDRLYGSKSSTRVMLHAYSLTLPDELATKNRFMANIEQNMQQYIYDEFGLSQQQLNEVVQ